MILFLPVLKNEGAESEKDMYTYFSKKKKTKP